MPNSLKELAQLTPGQFILKRTDPNPLWESDAVCHKAQKAPPKETGKISLAEWREKNTEVNQDIFADIGTGEKQVLISKIAIMYSNYEKKNLYTMVITENGIMAIQIPIKAKGHIGEFKSNILGIKRMSSSNNQKASNNSEGINKDAKTGAYFLKIRCKDGYIFNIIKDGRRYDYREDLRLKTKPSKIIVNCMMEAVKKRYEVLSAKKAKSTISK
jgi:hypothetical protein